MLARGEEPVRVQVLHRDLVPFHIAEIGEYPFTFEEISSI